MKKFIIAVAAVSLAATAAMADHHEGGHHGKHHGKMFDKIDTNKDGAISREEQRAFSDRMFDKLDGDGNGLVTKVEKQAAREAWKARKAERKAASDIPTPTRERVRP